MPAQTVDALENIAYRQNAPGLEPARMSNNEDAVINLLNREELQRWVTKWDHYDDLFKRLQDDSIALYSQFERRETTIDAMLWPAGSYAKTQIYKLDHFLWLYHEGRCRELIDMLKMLLVLLRRACEEEWGDPVVLELEPLD
ncbi:hypothetical protein FKP32DRAFT_1671242 [Trametes sanguinea]|nr:hypothetical protein FKP32DRAFT_1671242 [Trametes sanguinea]